MIQKFASSLQSLQTLMHASDDVEKVQTLLFLAKSSIARTLDSSESKASYSTVFEKSLSAQQISDLGNSIHNFSIFYFKFSSSLNLCALIQCLQTVQYSSHHVLMVFNRTKRLSI